ncbi:hypothetical protein E0H75_30730 [Kribbella capetownensis]|uniref:LPXTG cell wall anchor domain-containing protein n=1 Tax=Kribbella capetownensis TaxID=1572659 RepID=A0A4R0JS38_9ACTN|nr:hypothetical protein [Kribbella capetownensis]TCC44905.1 hypothetical protein E0H75_30730 [Kribbella capetownensis]
MNHTRTAISVAALAVSATALGASTAAANHPAENGTVSGALIPHDPPSPKTVEIAVDDTTSEAVQAGASALGGAGIALGAVLLYRRRQVLDR